MKKLVAIPAIVAVMLIGAWSCTAEQVQECKDKGVAPEVCDHFAPNTGTPAP